MFGYDIYLYGSLAIGAITLLSALFYRSRQSSARTWPRTEATVGSASVEQIKEDAEVVWFVRVSYSFTVNGKHYGSMTDRMADSRAEALELAPKLAGKKFPVRYKQDKPQTSVVLEDEWTSAMSKRF